MCPLILFITMKHLNLLSTIGFVLLTVMNATAQTTPEQEVIAYIVKSTIFPEPNIRFLERLDKQIKENPGDTAKINLRKKYLKFYSSEKNVNPIILITETSFPFKKNSSFVEESKKFPSFDLKAYDDLIEKNKKSIIIQPIKELGSNVIYVTHLESNWILKGGTEDGWANYRKQYGRKPTIILSRPGFNATKDKAIIYYGSSSGPRSGFGYYITLEKANRKWIRKKNFSYYDV